MDARKKKRREYLRMTRDGLSVVIEGLSQGVRRAIRRFYLRRDIKKYGNFKSAMTAEQHRLAKSYWRQYSKHYTPYWHEILTAKTGVFDVHYVPVDIMFTEIEGHFNDWGSAHGIDNKNNYSMYFPEVRQPKTAFRFIRGVFHDEYYGIITLEKAVKNCTLFGEIIIKIAFESGKGLGISFWKAADGEDVLRERLRKLNCDVIAQEFISQHERLASINPSSINTIRVMTLLCASEVKIVKAYLQVGTTDAKQDQISAGGVDVSIDSSGKLVRNAVDMNYGLTTQHPCGLVYEGFEVPSYELIVAKAKELHKKMGNFRLISWDFAVAPDGEPVLIEMNLKYGGIMFHQTSSGPLFGAQTDAILDEVYGKNKR